MQNPGINLGIIASANHTKLTLWAVKAVVSVSISARKPPLSFRRIPVASGIFPIPGSGPWCMRAWVSLKKIRVNWLQYSNGSKVNQEIKAIWQKIAKELGL